MRNYIILNNQRSDEISGLIIQELAPISKPLQRTQVETIDGRDGDIVTPLGYAAYDKKITIGLYGDFDINEIIAYFATQGTAIFSNEPDKYYNYQILDQIDYERLVRFRVATVTMHVQPFKYSATEGTITVDASDTVSGEGSNIVLENTAEAPFTTLRHKGNATQTTYSGKNLLNIDFTSTAPTYAGIAITNNGDGTITVSGTTTAAAGYNLSPSATNQQNPLTLAPNTAYTQRLEILSGSASNFSIVPAFKDSGGTTRYNFFQNNQTTTTTDTMTCSYYNIYWGAAGRVIDATFRVWLEKGSDLASPYEPYVGGTASPNPDYPQDIQVVTGDSTVKVVGKNLLDKATVTQSYRLGSTGDPFADNNYYLSDFIPVAQNTAYYISGVSGNAESSAVCFYASDKSFISRRAFVNDWYTFTTPANTAFLRFTTLKTHDINSVQLELGSTATAYEPYQGQSYVIPFGDTYLAKVGDYADEPVKVGDTWYIRRNIGKLNMADIRWDGLNGMGNPYRVGFVTDYGAENTTTISNIFAYSATAWAGNGKFGIASSGSLWMMTGDPTVDASNAPSWLANKNAVMYYALATPTDEEITDQDLIDALDEFYGQAHSYKGHTHITATAADGNAPAVLSVEVGEDNESTVTNAGNTTSRPILTIYGQGDIGVYINDVEVLDIALGNEQYITLDSTEMDAYKDSPANLKNRLVTGDYSKLALNAGANKIRFTGIVTKYEISKYSRWL